MPVRRLGPVVPVPGLSEPGRVHGAGMRHRQPRPSQAGSGQEERKSQDAALPEGTEHGAKLASAALLGKAGGARGELSVISYQLSATPWLMAITNDRDRRYLIADSWYLTADS